VLSVVFFFQGKPKMEYFQDHHMVTVNFFSFSVQFLDIYEIQWFLLIILSVSIGPKVIKLSRFHNSRFDKCYHSVHVTKFDSAQKWSHYAASMVSELNFDLKFSFLFSKKKLWKFLWIVVVHERKLWKLKKVGKSNKFLAELVLLTKIDW
jgi:hypothetical protein